MKAEPSFAKVTLAAIGARKKKDPPLVCLTAYYAYMARLLDRHADILLVGDSLGMVVYGMETTRQVTLEMMIAHGAAVARNACHAATVVDMPRGSYEESPETALRNASRLLRETGCDAVKLEGGASRAETVAHLVGNGVAVMGHIGLMPQNVRAEEGYRIVGRNADAWSALEEDAQALVAAGVFAMVLEGMVEPLARRISALVPVPTIGIGASPQCDGQILVTEDMLGLTDRMPRFVKQYADLGKDIAAAAAAYAEEVRARRFPGAGHVYAMAAAGPPAAAPRRNRLPASPEAEKAAGHG